MLGQILEISDFYCHCERAIGGPTVGAHNDINVRSFV